MEYVGRRTLYIWGNVVMFVILIIIGFLGIPEPSPAIANASGALLMIFTFTYDITVGPVCYCLVSEISSTRLRIKTVALARNCYNIASIIANFLNNPILNPTAWNMRGKGGFVLVRLRVPLYRLVVLPPPPSPRASAPVRWTSCLSTKCPPASSSLLRWTSSARPTSRLWPMTMPTSLSEAELEASIQVDIV